jgi:hypothetical protein
MQDRIQEEIRLIRTRFRDLDYLAEGNWVRIRSYPLPEGWNQECTEVAFLMIPSPAAPYGIYVPTGLQFKGQRPTNYTEPAPVNPPFGGVWGIFSWAPGDGEWRPASTVLGGSNYLNWALGFADRFSEGT